MASSGLELKVFSESQRASHQHIHSRAPGKWAVCVSYLNVWSGRVVVLAAGTVLIKEQILAANTMNRPVEKCTGIGNNTTRALFIIVLI